MESEARKVHNKRHEIGGKKIKWPNIPEGKLMFD